MMSVCPHVEIKWPIMKKNIVLFEFRFWSGQMEGNMNCIVADLNYN